jgi:hypothetical protein
MKKLLSNLTTHKKTMLGFILAVVIGLVISISALANYGHPIVAFNPNPVSITFPRAGKIVLWNVISSGSPGYFSRYYFIRNGCRVGQNCTYMDVINNQTVLTPIAVTAGETIQVKGCDCYGGNCGSGGCANPHVGWKTPHHNYFCPNYFYSQNYNPSAGGRDFTSLMTAFLASGDTIIGIPQCWGDWDEDNSNGGYDHDFEDFVLIWAYRDTFTGYHDGSSGTVPQAQCRAYGWVKQDSAPGLDINYRILVDGIPVANGVANQYRADLTGTCTGGTCGFSQDLWGLISPNVQHTVRVQAQNPYNTSWFDLSGTNKTIRCSLAASVDLKVNNQDGTIRLTSPAQYTLSWTSTNADTCSASGSWSGIKSKIGSSNYSGITVGTFTYTLTCSNPIGSASDSVTVIVYNPPIVDLKVNNQDGPITIVAPANFTLSWISKDATSCTAISSDGIWTGNVVVSGSRSLNGVATGTHTYTITCSNQYETVSDSVTVVVVAPLSGTISVTYARLLLFAPNLGQPGQTLIGTVSGGISPYSILVWVRTPSGALISLTGSGSTWSITPENSGDLNFGTTEEGIWTAWADLQDSYGQTYRTASAVWEVAWHPVHGRP